MIDVEGRMSSTALSEDESSDVPEAQESQDRLGLVIVWSADEPGRVGELAVVSPSGAEPWVLGRGQGRASDPGPRLAFTRSRPNAEEPTGPLTSPRLSRVQLLLRACGTEFLELENTGRCPLVRDDDPDISARLRPGHTLQLGRQLLFLCVKRPRLAAQQLPYATTPFGEADPYGIVGESPAIWSMRTQLMFAARRDGHVLLRGASGSGKELAAHAIHELSERASKAMVSRNAVTIPETLVDAELFGNLRDYPNKGMPERPGLVGQAHGCTLFLDEIGELPPGVQAHFLRVLDHGEYHRLGESTARLSDFRLLGATNRSDSALKHDLFARFAFVIDLPDLNGRREDVPLLMRFLLRRMATRDPQLRTRFFETWDSGTPRISLALTRKLVEHRYSTNVRELEALLWQAIMESTGAVIELPRGALGHDSGQSSSGRSVEAIETVPPCEADLSTVESLSAIRIQAVLDKHNGVIETAWRALGLKNRYVLTRLMAKYGIQVRRNRGRPLRRRANRGTSH